MKWGIDLYLTLILILSIEYFVCKLCNGIIVDFKNPQFLTMASILN